jgi:hypothetical protein
MKRPFMTKKHYEAIAATIRGLHEDHNMAWPDVALVAEQFADKLEQTNPLFKRDMFLHACGVDINVINE